MAFPNEQQQTGIAGQGQPASGQPAGANGANTNGQPTPQGPEQQAQGFVFPDGQPDAADPLSVLAYDPQDPWGQGTSAQESLDASPNAAQPQGHAQNGQQVDPQQPAGEGDPQGQPNPNGQPWQPTDLPEHMKPEDAYGMARYMQSEKDKLDQQYRQAQQQLAQFETVAPIAQMVLQDPQLLGYVQQRMQGQPIDVQGAPAQQAPQGGQPVQSGFQQQQAPTAMPEKPVRPEGYDPEEARLDPDSASARYERRMGEYRDQIVDWQARQLSAMQQTIQRQQQQALEAQQRQQQAIEMQQRQAQLGQRLQYEYGLPANEVSGFFEWASQQDQSNPALWVAAYKAQHQKPGANQIRQQQTQQAYQQRQGQTLPPMASGAPAQAAQAPGPPSGFVFQNQQGQALSPATI